tara:strand:- start:23 stop:703 length:681 start_codon:yes stop_codon:yes gene_type:complete
MIFNNYKKSKVGYIIEPTETIPKFMFQNITQDINCPAVSSHKNRMFAVKPLISMNIKFGIKDGEPYYNYEFDGRYFHTTPEIHDLIKRILVVQKTKSSNDKATLQVQQEFKLVTDDKDLEITVLEPMKKNYKNCEFIVGGFYPHSWIRMLNASYIQTDSTKEAEVKLNINEPIMRIFASKPIELKQIEETPEINSYYQYMHRITGYRKNLTNVYKLIVKHRPKKLL